MRKFEEVRDEFKVFPNVETKLPERSDSRSAGYDLHSKEDYVLQPGESHTFWTDVCATMFFDNVLMIGGVSGNPYVKGAKAEAKVLKHGKARKIKVYKYKQKKKYRRTQGHRQPYTKVEITKLVA